MQGNVNGYVYFFLNTTKVIKHVEQKSYVHIINSYHPHLLITELRKPTSLDKANASYKTTNWVI